MKDDANLKKYETSLKYEQALYKRIKYFVFHHYGFSPLSTAKILKCLKREKPDVVHLHSANCNMMNIYKILNYLKKNDIATVITNHAEFYYTGNCGYAEECENWKNGCGKCPRSFYSTGSKLFDISGIAWKKMKKAFFGFKRISVASVSPWVYDRSSISPIMQNIPQTIVLNGVNTEIFKIRQSNLREKLNIEPNKKIITHVTAGFSNEKNHRKGGYYILELAKRLQDIIFIVVGNLENKIDFPENVISVGKTSNQTELAEYYSLGNLSIITSDRETFSMPVAESLCCGTPIVGFCAGGPESINIKEYSEFVEYSNIDLLEETVLKWLDFKTTKNTLEISKKAIEKYNYKTMAQNYINLYRDLSNKS